MLPNPAKFLHFRTPDPRLPDARRSLPALAEDFLWGTATCAHQVEGLDSASDWWRFEREPGRVENFFTFSKHARDHKSDHYRRFSDDIRMMRRDLGVNSYRFSIDWSRVEPRPGQFEQGVIDRYAELCAEMRAVGIRPAPTLFHWSSPDWIWDHSRAHDSGWRHPSIVERFTRFVERIVPALAPHVDFWTTLNEPNVYLYMGYSLGVFAPGHKLPDEELVPIARHLLLAHREAYRIIKAHRADALVGIAQHCIRYESESRANPLEAYMAAVYENGFTWPFLDAVANGWLVHTLRTGGVIEEPIDGLAGTMDYAGVNFYQRNLVRVPYGVHLQRATVATGLELNRENWPEIYTASFVQVLKAAHRRYGLPIYVLENGCARTDERRRSEYLTEYVRALSSAVHEHGVPVKGYFYWSLLDNQEWDRGFAPRFGLYAVDYDTGARTLRDTGRLYAQFIASRGALVTGEERCA